MMPSFNVNYFAIIVCSVLTFVIGFFIYSVLFSKKWSEWTGMKPDPNNPINPAPIYLQALLITLVTFFVLANLVNSFNVTDFLGGAHLGLLCWFGFTMPVQFSASLFSGKTRKLFLLDTSYQLITMMISGGILAIWK